MALAEPHIELQPDRQATVVKALLRAAALLGISAKELSVVVGASEATLSRLKNAPGAVRLSTKAYELALLFIRLYRSLDAITGGDDEAARQWLRAENSALGGIPARHIRTIGGLTHVLAYLDARRAPL